MQRGVHPIRKHAAMSRLAPGPDECGTPRLDCVVEGPARSDATTLPSAIRRGAKRSGGPKPAAVSHLLSFDQNLKLTLVKMQRPAWSSPPIALPFSGPRPP